MVRMIKIQNVLIRRTLYTCDFGACSINVMVYTLCWNASVSSVWGYNVWRQYYSTLLKLSRVVLFMVSRYDILCICTCVTHRNTIERSYVDIKTESDKQLNDSKEICT